MTSETQLLAQAEHQHVFLGSRHAANERKAWAVIALCSTMMLIEIGGGIAFGSLALIADGLHMSTHAIAMLIAALAYTFARKHASDTRFSFGTGKVGDLAGFSSAIVLALIALLIGYEAVARFLAPVKISFREAIPIAFLGLIVNVVSAWLLSGGDDHHHGHGHTHHDSDDHSHADIKELETRFGAASVEIAEADAPPRFRLRIAELDADSARTLPASIETHRRDGQRSLFALTWREDYFESDQIIPEPHEFAARLTLGGASDATTHELAFEEAHDHAVQGASRDHNLRAAFIHVAADAAVSVLAILGLTAARYLGWLWMDPMMGIVGALVISLWAYALVRDTGRILLDMTPDSALLSRIRRRLEADGDRITDLHLWRLGPGHLGAILAIVTLHRRDRSFYRSLLKSFPSLSHVTVEVINCLPLASLPATEVSSESVHLAHR
jgi:cation diffusion facilitator family transporter